MKTIYKYKIDDRVKHFEMPDDAIILCVQIQHDYPCIWALIDPSKPMVQRTFTTVGTGWTIDDDQLHYIGTYLTEGNVFVWHVFEILGR